MLMSVNGNLHHPLDQSLIIDRNLPHTAPDAVGVLDPNLERPAREAHHHPAFCPFPGDSGIDLEFISRLARTSVTAMRYSARVEKLARSSNIVSGHSNGV